MSEAHGLTTFLSISQDFSRQQLLFLFRPKADLSYKAKNIWDIPELVKIVWSYLSQPSLKHLLAQTCKEVQKAAISQEKELEIAELEKFVSSVISFLKKKNKGTRTIENFERNLFNRYKLAINSLSNDSSWNSFQFKIMTIRKQFAVGFLPIKTFYGEAPSLNVRNELISENLIKWLAFNSTCSPCYRESMWSLAKAYEIILPGRLDSDSIEKTLKIS